MIKYLINPSMMAFLAVVMWSFSFPASKLVYKDFTAIDIVLFRHIIASLFFLTLILFGKVNRLKREDIFTFIIVSLIGITFYQILFVFGVSMVSPASASMIISMTPIFAALIAFIISRQMLSKAQLVGTFIGFLGVVIISTSKGTDGTAMGYLMLIAAAILMGAYFVLQKPLLERYSALDIVCFNTIIGTISLLWHTPSLLSSLSASPPVESIISIILMGIFSSGIGFIFWFWAISKSEPSKISMFLYVQPIIVGIMSWVWLSEVPSTNTVIGGILVIFSLFIANINWLRVRLLIFK